MKRVLTIGISILALATAVGAWAAASIEGSKHDFSNKDWADGETCGACHTPHRKEPPKAAPLWNPNADLKRKFGTSVTGTDAPGVGTTMCLRCHDGGVASDMMPVMQRPVYRGRRSSMLLGSGHGGTDHPVGVEYPHLSSEYQPETKVIAQGKVLLPDGKVECTSCHDPHNTMNIPHMLVTSNARSALCLTCHKK
jgi:predicted CXXCH cytochrome family protein